MFEKQTMKKNEFEKGIREYQKRHNEKMYSSEVKDLHIKYIQPILDKGAELFLAANPKAAWSAGFFQGDMIAVRVGIREKGIYREINSTYETDSLIDKISE